MNFDHLIFVGLNGYALALDRDSGEIVWSNDQMKSGYVTLLLDGDRLIASTNGYIYCLDPATGSILWNNPLKGYGMGAPTALASVRSDGMHLLIQQAAAAAASQQQATYLSLDVAGNYLAAATRFAINGPDRRSQDAARRRRTLTAPIGEAYAKGPAYASCRLLHDEVAQLVGLNRTDGVCGSLAREAEKAAPQEGLCHGAGSAKRGSDAAGSSRATRRGEPIDAVHHAIRLSGDHGGRRTRGGAECA